MNEFEEQNGGGKRNIEIPDPYTFRQRVKFIQEQDGELQRQLKEAEQIRERRSKTGKRGDD